MRTTSLRLLGGMIVLIFASRGFAQTGADLLVKVWPDHVKDFEFRGDGLFLGDAHVKQSDQTFTLAKYETEGRFRIIPGETISPRVGFDLRYFNLGGSPAGVPNQLIDSSVALGAGIAQKDGWIYAVKVGAGYAGPNPFSDGNAYYSLFDFVIGKDLDENHQIGFVLDYDGNRSSHRDIPLPGFAYRVWTYSHRVQVTLGFPYTSIEFKPNRQTTFEAVYSAPDDYRISFGWEFIPDWSAFASVGRSIDSFYSNDLANSSDRIFFQQRRAEIGLKYTPNDLLSFSLAGGFAWDQEFSEGFSTSSTHLLGDISDEPYIRFVVTWQY